MVTLIIHGWSDCSKSFVALKNMLVKCGAGQVQTILYADYESREDNLTFNDVADGLMDSLVSRRLIDKDGTPAVDLNVIVHSTGGLVIRHWIDQYYSHRMDKCPVKKIIMLAPANFGSPLAHRGKSFLGSFLKGRWKVGDLLEVGRNLLDGLELASPFQWDLAGKDLLRDVSYFNENQIQTTVLVGIEDYDGVRGWVNKPGTDGTVVISGTPLNSMRIDLDFCGKETAHYKWKITNTRSKCAFGVIEELDHGSIVDALADPSEKVTGLVLRALRTTSANDFNQFCDELTDVTEQTYKATKKRKYQQFLLHCVDDLGVSVKDYTLEFFIFRRKQAGTRSTVKKETMGVEEEMYTKQINELMLRDIHVHSRDSSFRRLLVDLVELQKLLAKATRELQDDVILSMRVYVPPVDRGISYNLDCLQNVILHDPKGQANGPSFFFPNTTTLVEMKVDRQNTHVTLGPDAKKH